MTHISNKLLPFVILPLAALGIVAATFFTSAVNASRPQLPDDYVDSDLTFNGSNLKGYALGAEGLIADYYWMRSLQYIGDKVAKADLSNIDIQDLTSLNPRLLYPLLENATDLDPHFMAAYSYGAIVLPAIDAEKAIAFTKKGIANNPDQWRLYQYLGYIYWRLGRYKEAADTYDEGAKIQESPQFMRLMSASMQNEGGSRETARSMYTQMRDEAPTDDEQTRTVAVNALNRLIALDQMDAVNAILARSKAEANSCPNSLAAIYPQLTSVRLPNDEEFQINASNKLVDPSEAAYFFDRDKCEIHLDYSTTKVPIR